MKKGKAKIIFAVPKENPRFESLWSEYAKSLVEKFNFDLTFIKDDNIKSSNDWKHCLSGHDGIITSWPTPCLNEENLPNDDSLKIIGHAAGSVADLVSEEVFRRKIKVCGCNSVMAESVAELCLSMTLFAHTGFLDFACIGGANTMRWQNSVKARSIKDAVIGIWGYGDIAKRYIAYLKPLCPQKIKVCSEHLSKEELSKESLFKVGLEELFETSDIIVTLAGLTRKNIDRIGIDLLRRIKGGTVLVNCGRARLFQEDSLMEELEKNRFIACFDVFYEEPLPENSPLQYLPNVILTPHCGAKPSIKRYVPVILEEFRRFFDGEPLQYEIDPDKTGKMTRHGKIF